MFAFFWFIVCHNFHYFQPDNEACVKKILSGGSESPSQRSRESKSRDKEPSSREHEREHSSDKRKRRSEKDKSGGEVRLFMTGLSCIMC